MVDFSHEKIYSEFEGESGSVFGEGVGDFAGEGGGFD